MSICSVRPGIVITGLGLLFLLTVQPLNAQEVQWRNDFNAARREAKEKNRPVVMDFGTTNCCWCRKLDAVTFRDPAIVRQLNEQFIPLKIDADREPSLTQALHIQSYPTLVFAAPDGKILGSHAGFVDATQFGQQLRRALAESMPATAKEESPGTVPTNRGQVDVRTTAPPVEPVLYSPERVRLASDVLAQAQDDLRRQQYLGCLERCHLLRV